MDSLFYLKKLYLNKLKIKKTSLYQMYVSIIDLYKKVS